VKKRKQLKNQKEIKRENENEYWIYEANALKRKL
jgi:hypothetical protein